MTRNHSISLTGRELTLSATAGWVMIVLVSVSLVRFWSASPALQWLLQAGLTWWYVTTSVSNRLHLNRPGFDAALYDDLGWANRLTIFRGWLIAVTAGFLFLNWPPGMLIWLPGIFYTCAAIIDRFDGYVARRSGRTSMLGVELDTLFDALGLAVAPLLAVWYGQIHWSYLLFSGAWYLFQGGIYWRRRNGLPVHNLAPNIVRRTWAGFQMGFIGIALLPVFTPSFTRIAGIAFVIPVLIGFFIDWLLVSGRIDRDSVTITTWFNRYRTFEQGVLQPLLRVSIIIMVLVLTGLPETVFELLLLIPAVLVLSGLAGRSAALVLILLFGYSFREQEIGHLGQMLTFALVWVMLLGTGRYSLWRPDEQWINRYDGA